MSAPIGVLLAAGEGRRFGTHKLLHPLPDGRLLGVAAAGNLIAALPGSVAVIRPGDVEMQTALAGLGFQLIVSAEVARGMGSSLALAVRATRSCNQGWVVALADMPWIERRTIHMIAARVEQGARLVAPEYAGRRGHPVGFAAQWGEQLAQLSGDSGARTLLSTNLSALELLAVDDPGVLLDVDSADQLLHDPGRGRSPAVQSDR